MNTPQWIIHQQITVNQIKIGSMSNSSILQIGTVGSIQSRAELANSGQFTKPAPPAITQGKTTTVPLVNP
ncbi:spore germination protein GerPB [Jeotgalibacillus campisalis]|uniref:Spore germination protein n=1 Tax=Jeotgalibacillus campisalis TaxID=220754 RepID=A0A0C2VTP8_9BACL|nr:spore germination protein GerPB [Jeotgalibacillus campisalis]KIL47368.1 spore germination protein [Jeotgalibacillus campisalis]